MLLAEINVSLYTSTTSTWLGLFLTSLILDLVASLIRLFSSLFFLSLSFGLWLSLTDLWRALIFFFLFLSHSQSALRSSFASVQLRVVVASLV